MPGSDPAFAQAYAAVRALPGRPDNDTLLRLYALARQALHGDAPERRPGCFDLVGQAKQAAWSRLHGMPCDEASRRYVELAGSLQQAMPPRRSGTRG